MHETNNCYLFELCTVKLELSIAKLKEIPMMDDNQTWIPAAAEHE